MAALAKDAAAVENSDARRKHEGRARPPPPAHFATAAESVRHAQRTLRASSKRAPSDAMLNELRVEVRRDLSRLWRAARGRIAPPRRAS